MLHSNPGVREAEINVAEGRKRARVLKSEAYQTEQINHAKGRIKFHVILFDPFLYTAHVTFINNNIFRIHVGNQEKMLL